MWRDVSGTVGGGGSNGRWTVVSSDTCVLKSFVQGDVSGTVRGGRRDGKDGGNGSRTVVS